MAINNIFAIKNKYMHWLAFNHFELGKVIIMILMLICLVWFVSTIDVPFLTTRQIHLHHDMSIISQQESRSYTIAVKKPVLSGQLFI